MKSVYVGNLPYATTENELKDLFAQYGQVFGARIKTDRETGRPLGYGFVQMEDADADKAIEALNGKDIGGRNLRVNESRERTDRPPQRDFGGGGGYDRPPRRDFNDRDGGGGYAPRREFNSDRGGFDNRPPRRDFDAPRGEGEGGGHFGRKPGGFDGGMFDDKPRRREFKKNDKFSKDFREGDRPRRPPMKTDDRKKKFRPNEDYEQEE